MPTIKVSEVNKARLDLLLSEMIGKQRNPALVMDDAVSELFERANKK